MDVLLLGSVGEVSGVCGALTTPTGRRTSSVGRGGRVSCGCCCCWVWGLLPVTRRFYVWVEEKGGL